MSKTDYLIKNGLLVNDGQIIEGDLLIQNGRIEKVGGVISSEANYTEIDAKGCFVMPGIIDDQVHFREPGLTHKACIASESRAAVAGGVTSFMEMPNTKPPATTQALLQDKYDIAAAVSPANYSFFMGCSNDNYDEVMKTDLSKVCGLKIFMGSSTGNMLVDDEHILSRIFAQFEGLIATHCEDEQRVKQRLADAKEQYGDFIPYAMHPVIRDVEACWLSSSKAKELAVKHGTRLHILHITTAKELELFEPGEVSEKHITSEVCVHHLWFDAEDYYILGSRIKCNPAIKEKANRKALLQAVLDNRIDVLATDHAPHTLSEKQNPYDKAPAGLPLVQHPLNIMMEFYHKKLISLEHIVEKMCHAPARLFRIPERGYLREGYFADVVILDPKERTYVNRDNILYQCGWSPFEGMRFNSRVTHTFVNGHLAWHNGKVDDSVKGQRLRFSL